MVGSLADPQPDLTGFDPTDSNTYSAKLGVFTTGTFAAAQGQQQQQQQPQAPQNGEVYEIDVDVQGVATPTSFLLVQSPISGSYEAWDFNMNSGTVGSLADPQPNLTGFDPGNATNLGTLTSGTFAAAAQGQQQQQQQPQAPQDGEVYEIDVDVQGVATPTSFLLVQSPISGSYEAWDFNMNSGTVGSLADPQPNLTGFDPGNATNLGTLTSGTFAAAQGQQQQQPQAPQDGEVFEICLLYTSDAADE